MTVLPTVFKGNPGGVWTVAHDDAVGGAHGGAVDPATVSFGTLPDGSSDFSVIVLRCPFPGCGWGTAHPIGGGAAAPKVQEMFVRQIIGRGIPCPCGNLPAGRPVLLVIAHMKAHAEKEDYAGRWQVASVTP